MPTAQFRRGRHPEKLSWFHNRRLVWANYQSCIEEPPEKHGGQWRLKQQEDLLTELARRCVYSNEENANEPECRN
jgi:hypothetical protein